MVLRRFGKYALHDLFKMKGIRPIKTMVGFYDLLELPVKVGFGEKWTTFNDTFFSVFQDIIGIQFDTIPGLENIVATGKNSPFAQDVMYEIGKKLGFIGIESPYGNANLVHEAAVREVSGEDLHTGLKTDFQFTFETVYDYREIPGQDSSKLLKKIINNARQMGTSDAVFLAGQKGVKEATNFFAQLKNGDMTGLIQTMISTIKEVVGVALKTMEDIFMADGGNNNGDDESGNTTAKPNNDYSRDDNPVFRIMNKLGEAMGTLLKARYLRYEWKITGVLGAISGTHTAPWHITLGNPKKPWFSMGNLVLENMSIEPTGELMYDDFPSEWKVTATLKNGRAMGGREIFDCFTPGTVREYTTKEQLSKTLFVNVPEGTTINVEGKNIPPDAPNNKGVEIQKNDVENNPELIDPTNNGTLSDFAKE